MLEIILIISVIFLILTFFYKQAVCEFRINQIEWNQKDKIQSLLHEKIPLVIRGIPSSTFWTYDDISARHCYKDIPVFQETTLSDWVNTIDSSTICPWGYPQGKIIGKKSGLEIWSQKWINSIIINPVLKWWLRPEYHCWAGNIGLRKTYATWNCIFPTDGEIIVTIMPENSESALPANWLGCFPSMLSNKDTPFINDLKYIDIILRPGNCLFMPAHWFWSWTSHNSEKASMACTISYHTPISSFAFSMVNK